MGRGRPKAELVVTAEQQQQLQSIANSRSLPAGLVKRARIILLSALGKSNQQMAEQLELRRSTVGKWRRRFLTQGLMGLHDELRPGRPRSISDERVARVVRKTLSRQPKDATHWSVYPGARQTLGSRYHLSTAFPLGLTECNGTSNPCESRSRLGREADRRFFTTAFCLTGVARPEADAFGQSPASRQHSQIDGFGCTESINRLQLATFLVLAR